MTDRLSPARLEYEQGDERLERPLDGSQVTLGRDPRNDLQIDLPSISRRHAILRRTDHGWRVEDRKSLTGTFLNDSKRLDRVLQDGDVIRLGRYPLTFRSPRVGVLPEGTVLLSAEEIRRFADAEAGETTVETLAETADGDAEATIVRGAVDFATLASGGRPRDDESSPRLARLLALVTSASRAVLETDGRDGEQRTFDDMLQIIFDHLPVDRGCIMRWVPSAEQLRPVCQRDRGGGRSAALRFSRTIAAWVLRDRVAVLTTDARADERFAEGDSVVGLGIRSAMCAPVWHREQVEGLIYVDSPQRAGAFDRFDLDLLSAIGNHLSMALERSRLQAVVVEQQLARRRLERYHSPAVVERILADSAEGVMTDERDVTVLFADLVGFTARCERLTPREIAAWLNRAFEAMSETIFLHEGTLDKFLGDGLMAVFGAPFAQEDHAARAVQAALEMRAALDTIAGSDGGPTPVLCRIGLHSGRVVAGDLGSTRRSDYTVLGATVNTAARIEGSVAAPGQIVVSEQTRHAAGDRFRMKPLGGFRLKGLSVEIECHEVLGSDP